MSEVTEIVHWPGKDVPACDEHAKRLKALGAAMGVMVSSTPWPAGGTCTNCEKGEGGDYSSKRAQDGGLPDCSCFDSILAECEPPAPPKPKFAVGQIAWCMNETLHARLVWLFATHRYLLGSGPSDAHCTCGFKHMNLDTGVTITHPEHLATLAVEQAVEVIDEVSAVNDVRAGVTFLEYESLIAALGKVKGGE